MASFLMELRNDDNGSLAMGADAGVAGNDMDAGVLGVTGAGEMLGILVILSLNSSNSPLERQMRWVLTSDESRRKYPCLSECHK